MWRWIAALGLGVALARARVWDFEKLGAVPDKDGLKVAWANGALLNRTLAALQPYDELVIPPKTYVLMGGVVAWRLHSVVLRIEGTLRFKDEIKAWPRDADNKVLACLTLRETLNVTITSSSRGTLDGMGDRWWGVPGVGYLRRGEDRPRLVEMHKVVETLVERLLLKNSPYWTFYARDVASMEVRYVIVDARRTDSDWHDSVDMTAFNTDGFDFAGRNVYGHHLTIWNQDDCIAVKDDSQDMLFEHIQASGVGLTIGSIGAAHVRNITFRHITMHHTYKGIYLKFRPTLLPGLIEDVTFENVTMDEPSQWPIWIGPAQQSDSSDLCAAHPCSICWPEKKSAKCRPVLSRYRNIVLKDIFIEKPKQSPGVIFADDSVPIDGLVFDNVVVTKPGSDPWAEDYYFCEGVRGGVARGKTWPIPHCLEDQTVAGALPAVAMV